MRFYFPIDKENRIVCDLLNGKWAIWLERLYGTGWANRSHENIGMPANKMQEFSKFLERIDKLMVLK